LPEILKLEFYVSPTKRNASCMPYSGLFLFLSVFKSEHVDF